MEHYILIAGAVSDFFLSVFIILVIVGTICEVHTKMIQQREDENRYWYGDGLSQEVITEQNTEPNSDPMTEEDWNVICRTAIEKAKNGDGKARDWITKHMSSEGSSSLKVDAISALVNLGIKKKEATTRVSEALNRGSYASLDDLIKAALNGK
jgi:hypothetical protein